MFIKPLQIPTKLERLDALLRRLAVTHPKYERIKSERIRRYAGYIGEKLVAYQLKTIDEDHYSILHDLCLKIGDLHFQIDFLLLTTRYVLIIETKNFAGTLLFDDQGQFIRILNEQQEGYSDPVAQSQYHQRCLRKWLSSHHFPTLPVDYVVVVSKPSSIIKMENTDPEIRKRVLPASKLSAYVDHLNHFPNETIDLKTQRKLCKQFLKMHSPYYSNLLKEYNLAEKDLFRGVQCPECFFLPMTPFKGHWRCPSCNCKSKDADQKAVQDYFLLIGPTITNRQLRDFLQISSVQKSRRLLTSMNLPYTGDKKGRIYYQRK